MATEKRDEILDAAYECFAQYGFRRTSMQDVAKAAGISRAAVYLHFKNKEDVFRALSLRVHERVLAAAEAAGTATEGIEDRLRAVLSAKLLGHFQLVHRSLHGRELLDENNRLCGDVSAEYRTRHVGLVARLLGGAERAGELRLRGLGLDADAAAELIMDCAKGLEDGGAPSADVFRRRVGDLTRVLACGLGAVPATARGGGTRRRPAKTARRRG